MKAKFSFKKNLSYYNILFQKDQKNKKEFFSCPEGLLEIEYL